MKYINFAIACIIMFGFSSTVFLDCHLQDTAYREIRRFFPVEWKRASNLGSRMCQLDSRFYVGKKFVGYSAFDNYSKMQRKSRKLQRSFNNNYQVDPYESNEYLLKWNH
ncbi:uncharacterized protein LOC126833474 isoform X2 [Adelges cooleyi]|uniref:uncharacterized protein LOC126833474 isoform X2 n=1 Tax=Adelges cooleyi TaxID=133065 RepID=UPI0021802C10|nr:uncharacterized protein LOC126833474 isoform X2 [Adelges cooleyi]